MLAFLDPLREFTFVSAVLRMLLAMLCGGVVGYGRSQMARPAGFRTYMLISIGAAMSVLLLSHDRFSIEENLSAVTTCMNNIGFGVGRFSPSGNLGGLDSFSKVVLCFDMLLGRLEIYPLILLFARKKD